MPGIRWRPKQKSRTLEIAILVVVEEVEIKSIGPSAHGVARIPNRETMRAIVRGSTATIADEICQIRSARDVQIAPILTSAWIAFPLGLLFGLTHQHIPIDL